MENFFLRVLLKIRGGRPTAPPVHGVCLLLLPEAEARMTRDTWVSLMPASSALPARISVRVSSLTQNPHVILGTDREPLL